MSPRRRCSRPRPGSLPKGAYRSPYGNYPVIAGRDSETLPTSSSLMEELLCGLDRAMDIR